MAGLDQIFKLAVVLNMVDNLTSPLGKATAAVENSISKFDKLTQSSMNLIKGGTAMTGTGIAITKAVLSPVAATFATGQAIGELAAMGVEDLTTLKNAAVDFSGTWAGTSTPEFLSAAVDIKGGIDSLSEEGIAKYTELAGITAKATGSTVAEMTSLFATGYGIYKDFYDELSDIEFAETFSAGLAQAILTFKASGSSMAQSVTALGAAATTANVPLEEQLTVLGMLQATMSGSEAGTKYRAFLRTAAKAGKELGLSFVDTNKQLLSMPEILGRLQGKYGETLDAVEKQQIQTAFGSDEAVALIDLMYSKTGALQDNILTLNGAMGDGAEVTRRMADTINSTDASNWDLAGQRIANIKEQLGESLLPTINTLLDKAEPLTDKVSAFIDANPELTSGIMVAALALGAVTTVAGVAAVGIGGLGLIFGTLGSGVTKIVGLINGAKGAFTTLQIVALYAGDGIGFLLGKGKLLLGGIPKIAGAVKGFFLLITANPLGLAIAGIAALVVGGIALYKNFDTIKAKADALAETIIGIPGKIKDGFTNAFPGVTRTLSAGLDKIKALLPQSDAKTGPLSHLTDSGEKLMTTFAGGGGNEAEAPARAVERAMRRPDLSSRWELPTYDLPARVETSRTEKETKTSTEKRGMTISRLILNADLKQIEDIQKLRQLLDDLEDLSPEGEPDPA
ncbi:MAG: phage tail tape measure protein [Peptococcaceae bacterium]|nr:phage tail tape measure protein [Peptococcaceae bacterium]